MNTKLSRRALNLGLFATVLTAAGCSGAKEAGPAADPLPTSEDGTVAFDKKVTIVVGDKPTADRTEDLALWEKKVETFTAKYPSITLEAKEQVYDATTFQAQLAGGNLPTQMLVPFTEPQGLASRQQIADLTDTLKAVGLTEQLNPQLLENATSDGRVFAVPTEAYALGLVFNRDLLTQAGLDPETPPTTWEELKAQAKQVAERTGQTGFAFPTTKNVGGWLFTTICYSFGGTVQNTEGTEITVNQEPCVRALTHLQGMRWEDDSMGSTFVYEGDPFEKDFAAGKIGFRIGNPGTYWSATVNNGMDAKTMGVSGLPQDGGVHGTLGGGAVAIVSPKASEDEKTAAVLWVKHHYLDRYVDEEKAKEDATTRAEADLPVGLPEIYPLSEGTAEQYRGWIEDQVNVPVKNYQHYVDSEVNDTIIPEPRTKAQEMYAALDPIIQRVLTDKEADPQQLLDEAAENLKAKLGR